MLNTTNKKVKYIFISGGVLSGLGKGITTSSLALILKSKGYSVSPLKIDMYLNMDAGTIRPQEHGEVFVTDDGMETDQDLGNYERFIDENLSKDNYATTGQVYWEVLNRERSFEYDGEDVEAIPHVTDEIIHRVKKAGVARKADIVLIELGGTAGEIQNAIFFEAARLMKLRNPEDVVHIHVAYLPIPKNLGEMKSKPVQLSVGILNSMGIQPDFIVGRAEHEIDDRRKERLALFCNVHKEDVISAPDVDTIYKVPLVLAEQNFGEKILQKLRLPEKDKDLAAWRQFVEKITGIEKTINIAVVGKYFGTGNYQLDDVYVSVIEALKHAGWQNNVQTKLTWFDSDTIDKKGTAALKEFDGIVVPGGFGSRGVEGLIKTIQFARENQTPYFGLCYGMQLAVIEFARNVLYLTGAHTTEVDADTPHPVIHIMPDQEKKMLLRDYGASMRLGAWQCLLKTDTLAFQAYRQDKVWERHRHRYEVNNAYRDQFEKAGFKVSGTSPDGKLVEIMELAGHSFFLGTQFHPEFTSRPLKGQPLFNKFIEAIVEGW